MGTAEEKGQYGSIEGLLRARAALEDRLPAKYQSEPPTLISVSYEQREARGSDGTRGARKEMEVRGIDESVIKDQRQPEPTEEQRLPDPGEPRRSKIASSEGTAIAFVGRPGVLKEIM